MLQLAERGALLFSDDFSKAAPGWSGKLVTWEIVDGVALIAATRCRIERPFSNSRSASTARA